MAEERTTAVVERYLNELAGVSGNSPAEPIIRALLSAAVGRLHLLCATLLHRNYPRLQKPPLNLQSEEMLSGVVERMMKAMRKVRPQTVRQFFALANQHMRWELNDVARQSPWRLTERPHCCRVTGEASVACNRRRHLSSPLMAGPSQGDSGGCWTGLGPRRG